MRQGFKYLRLALNSSSFCLHLLMAGIRATKPICFCLDCSYGTGSRYMVLAGLENSRSLLLGFPACWNDRHMYDHAPYHSLELNLWMLCLPQGTSRDFIHFMNFAKERESHIDVPFREPAESVWASTLQGQRICLCMEPGVRPIISTPMLTCIPGFFILLYCCMFNTHKNSSKT